MPDDRFPCGRRKQPKQTRDQLLFEQTEWRERARHLPAPEYGQRLVSAAFGTLDLTLDDLHQAYFWVLHDKYLGNLQRVAKVMGTDRRTLREWLHTWERGEVRKANLKRGGKQ